MRLPLPDEPSAGDWCGSALKLAAMVLKRDYLEGGSEHVKEVFRGFQSEGERLFNETRVAAVSPWSRFLLASGYPIEWRERRKDNVLIFLDLVNSHPFIKPLFSKWPVSHCPFNAVILFPSKSERDECRSRLIKANVYPAVHWELGDNSAPDSLDLSVRILTIPVDQRYGEKEVKRVVSLLFNKQ
jgi:hypothetical protein